MLLSCSPDTSSMPPSKLQKIVHVHKNKSSLQPCHACKSAPHSSLLAKEQSQQLCKTGYGNDLSMRTGRRGLRPAVAAPLPAAQRWADACCGWAPVCARPVAGQWHGRQLAASCGRHVGPCAGHCLLQLAQEHRQMRKSTQAIPMHGKQSMGLQASMRQCILTAAKFSTRAWMYAAVPCVHCSVRLS